MIAFMSFIKKLTRGQQKVALFWGTYNLFFEEKKTPLTLAKHYIMSFMEFFKEGSTKKCFTKLPQQWGHKPRSTSPSNTKYEINMRIWINIYDNFNILKYFIFFLQLTRLFTFTKSFLLFHLPRWFKSLFIRFCLPRRNVSLRRDSLCLVNSTSQ